MSAEIISSHVDVSLNEYVTKYSINRNFLKLVENDKSLSAEIDAKLDEGLVHSYILGKTYSRGNCVFYKTTVDSQSLYLLCCDAEDTTSQPPQTYLNKAGDIVVRSSDDWKIVGIPHGMEASPRDYALEYVNSNKQQFLSAHQDNTALSAHPTGPLGMKQSSIAFTTLENIKEDRRTFFYPNQFRTLNADNTIIAGYMRKWDNGLLEYDVVFRVGSAGEFSDDGQALISANNLEVYHRNQNFLYFKDNADFKLFSQSNGYHITTNGTKQVNLNTNINAYFGEIQFPEEFMDLNYMVFTSQEKNIETEAKSINNEVLKPGEYDSRLKINGLTITGCDAEADYEKELFIPDQVVNIGQLALAYVEETNSLPLKITIDPDKSKLKNIEDRAFESTALRTIVIPKATRSIGEKAFCNCLKLENVDIYVNKDRSKQPVIDFNAFDGATNLSTINLYYYRDPVKFAASLPPEEQQRTEERISAYANEYDLSTKLADTNFQKVFGINNGATKVTEVIVHDKMPAPKMLAAKLIALAASAPAVEEEEVQYITINIQDFLKKYAPQSQQAKSKKMLAATPSFAALPSSLSDCFFIENNVIVGWDPSKINEEFSLDFSDSTMTDITAIGDNALADCSFLTSLNVVDGALASIGQHAFARCTSMRTASFNRSDWDAFNVADSAFEETTASQISVIGNSSVLQPKLALPSFVQELVLSGNGDAKLLQGLSGVTASSVSVIGFTYLAPSALLDIAQIREVKFFTPDHKTLAVDQHVFAADGHEKENMFITRGNNGSISCASNALAYLTYDDDEDLVLDLENVQLDISAFVETEGQTLKLVNWDKGTKITTSVGGKPIYELTAFAEGAFAGAFFNDIYFADQEDMEDVSKTLIVGTNMNVLSCEDMTSLRSKIGSAPDKTYGYTVYNGQLVSNPKSDYLFIDDDNVLVSCIWDKIAEIQELYPDETRIIVPFGVTAISTDAFSLECPERCISSISEIALPATLKKLHDGAFSGIRDLSVLQFEDGTELTSVGEHLFTAETQLLAQFRVVREL